MNGKKLSLLFKYKGETEGLYALIFFKIKDCSICDGGNSISICSTNLMSNELTNEIPSGNPRILGKSKLRLL